MLGLVFINSFHNKNMGCIDSIIPVICALKLSSAFYYVALKVLLLGKKKSPLPIALSRMLA